MASNVISQINTAVVNLSESIGTAIAALNKSIDDEESARETAVSGLISDREGAVSGRTTARKSATAAALSDWNDQTSTLQTTLIGNYSSTETSPNFTTGKGDLTTAYNALDKDITDTSAAAGVAFHFVGSCKFSELPESASEGDVYNITDSGSTYDGVNYAYVKDADGKYHWDALSQIFDFGTTIDNYSTAFTDAANASA